MKDHREFTEEEIRKLIHGIINFKPATRWEIFRDWFTKVVLRRKK